MYTHIESRAPQLETPPTAAIGPRLPLTFSLLCIAFGELVLYDVLALWGFKHVRAAVSRTRRRVTRDEPDADTVIRVVDAVRSTCVLYFKKNHCLQRAFVATRMLRRRGIAATLIIGSQPTPIRSHAWVEVDGVPVINRTTHLTFYQVIDRW
jgi:hypothetical protein